VGCCQSLWRYQSWILACIARLLSQLTHVRDQPRLQSNISQLQPHVPELQSYFAQLLAHFSLVLADIS
jgi:hypothetical protein